MTEKVESRLKVNELRMTELLYSLVDSNLENPSFGVEEISRELGTA